NDILILMLMWVLMLICILIVILMLILMQILILTWNTVSVTSRHVKSCHVMSCHVTLMTNLTCHNDTDGARINMRFIHRAGTHGCHHNHDRVRVAYFAPLGQSGSMS